MGCVASLALVLLLILFYVPYLAYMLFFAQKAYVRRGGAWSDVFSALHRMIQPVNWFVEVAEDIYIYLRCKMS